MPSPTASGPAPQQPDDLEPDETWLGSVELRSQDVVSAEAELADVVASGSGVRFSPEGLRADRLDIDATIPFETVAEQVGEDVRIYPAGGGLAGIERQVTLLGRDVTRERDRARSSPTAASCSSSPRPSTSAARPSSTRRRAPWPAPS